MTATAHEETRAAETRPGRPPTDTVSRCTCGAWWTHPGNRPSEVMDAIFLSHVKYFENKDGGAVKEFLQTHDERGPRYKHATTKPMRLSRFATLWECEGEVEQVPNATSLLKYMYQSLSAKSGQDAEPYCWGLNTVSFFPHGWTDNRVGVPEIERRYHYGIERRYHYDFSVAPHLLHIEGRWWEVSGDKVCWRNGEWQFRFTLDARTRAARFANGGAAYMRENP